MEKVLNEMDIRSAGTSPVHAGAVKNTRNAAGNKNEHDVGQKAMRGKDEERK